MALFPKMLSPAPTAGHPVLGLRSTMVVVMALCCCEPSSPAAADPAMAPPTTQTRIGFAPSDAPESHPHSPSFDGADGRRKIARVQLRRMLWGFQRPTDIQFVPGNPHQMVVLEKGGTAWWVDTRRKMAKPWFEVDVATRSEQGLLGLAFHPRFAENGQFYTHYSQAQNWRKNTGRITKWKAQQPGPESRPPTEVQTILEVPQPWVNHNGGQVLFGPDGFLYIGFGDGGAADDPKGHGQNTGTLLGAMLRIDVDRTARDRPYGIPPDNPFVGMAGARPEIYAFGLRNPWRYTFTADQRLVGGDVGQNLWEEVTFIPKGGNLGWKIREGASCFVGDGRCKDPALIDPIYTYGRKEGQSITGGQIYGGKSLPTLQGKYVFGDFASGRLWALEIPKPGAKGQVDTVLTLGRWPISPSTFARRNSGEIIVADFRKGVIYELVAPSTPGSP